MNQQKSECRRIADAHTDSSFREFAVKGSREMGGSWGGRRGSRESVFTFGNKEISVCFKSLFLLLVCETLERERENASILNEVWKNCRKHFLSELPSFVVLSTLKIYLQKQHPP